MNALFNRRDGTGRPDAGAPGPDTQESGPGTQAVQAAAKYADPGDLGVILCLFNIGSNRGKIGNFTLCRAPLWASGIPVIVVECAFGDDPWILGSDPDVVRVRTPAALWQKEKLLNLGVSLLPDRCTKVAWIDADILFQNPAWAVTASELLDDVVVLQLADRIVRLPRCAREYTGNGHCVESFASVYLKHPNALLLGDFGVHGHTGFGWAARRSAVEAVGLYDACIAGGGDHVMAHAFCGDWESACLTRMMGSGTAWHFHAAGWAQKAYQIVKARVGVVPGTALHLWHGELTSRRHVRRYDALRSSGFDPERDLELDGNGCWRWVSEKSPLDAAMAKYMARRRAENGSLVMGRKDSQHLVK